MNADAELRAVCAYTTHHPGRPWIPVVYRRREQALKVSVDAAPDQVDLRLCGVTATEAVGGRTAAVIRQPVCGMFLANFGGREPRTVILGKE